MAPASVPPALLFHLHYVASHRQLSRPSLSLFTPPPAVSLVLYLHYVVSMVREICAFLCIPCLTVRKVD